MPSKAILERRAKAPCQANDCEAISVLTKGYCPACYWQYRRWGKRACKFCFVDIVKNFAPFGYVSGGLVICKKCLEKRSGSSWSLAYDACRACKLTSSEYIADGLCAVCYHTRRRNSETLVCSTCQEETPRNMATLPQVTCEMCWRAGYRKIQQGYCLGLPPKRVARSLGISSSERVVHAYAFFRTGDKNAIPLRHPKLIMPTLEIMRLELTEQRHTSRITWDDPRWEAYVYGARRGNNNAWAFLFNMAERQITGPLLGEFYLRSGDRNDMLAHARYGLVQAVRAWRPGLKSVPGFIRLCMRRRIMDALSKERSIKDRAFTESYSLDTALRPDDQRSGHEKIADTRYEPEKVLWQDTDPHELVYSRLPDKLGELEKAVIRVYIENPDLTMPAVANILGVLPKAVDNALQRIREKAKAHRILQI